MDAQQELFSYLKVNIEALGYAVYDGFLPPEGTPYPFVYLGDSQQSDISTKGASHGVVYQTIHVYSNTPKQRGTLSAMLADIKMSCKRVVRTKNFAWHASNITTRIMPDNTTKTPLLHGIVEVDFKFS